MPGVIIYILVFKYYILVIIPLYSDKLLKITHYQSKKLQYSINNTIAIRLIFVIVI